MSTLLLLSLLALQPAPADAPTADQAADQATDETADQPVDAGPNTPGVQDADGSNVSSGQIDADLDTAWGTVDRLVSGFVGRLPFILIAIVTFLLFYVAAKVSRALIRRFTAKRRSANVGRVLGRVAQWVIILIGLMVAVAIIAPSVTPGKLLSTLGIGGVAIGFAFKDVLQNFLAGILILLNEPFEVGDQIVSGDHEGTVETIETRATLLKTYDGRRVVIPNSDVYTRAVVVKTHYPHARSQYTVGVGYGDDLDKAIRVVLETVRGTEGVVSDPAPDVLVTELAGSTVNLTARWWAGSSRAEDVSVSSRVVRNIKLALDDAAIDMSYPTQVVLFHDQTEATDGDRTQQREGWPAGDDPPQPRPVGSV